VSGVPIDRLIGEIARALLGRPNTAPSYETELRYGSHGSLRIDLKKGVWFDFEAGEGGGALDLISRETGIADGPERWDKAEELAGVEIERPVSKLGGNLTYDYTDESGTLLFQVVRLPPKRFRQRRPDKRSRGGWSWSVKGVRKVPYRLCELIEHVAQGHTILIVEGEKDCDNLRRLGVPATTNAGGAGKWKPELNKYFAGADVVLVPDSDEAGYRHIEQVGTALSGIAARLRVLRLPDLRPKGDVSDWLAAGGTRETLDQLIEQAPAWKPASKGNGKDVDEQGLGLLDEQAKAKAQADEQELLDALARLTPLEYEQRRGQAAEELGIRRGALDREVGMRREVTRAAPLYGHWEVQPWPEPVEADALLEGLTRRVQQHVVLPPEAAHTVALWVLFAWVHETAAVHSPILMVTSAERDCGKTTLLNLVSFLTPRSLVCVEISEAALFRAVELWQPTIVVDEADVILVNNEPLRAVINSGWTKGACVLRCIGDERTPHPFPTFCAKAIGLKGRKLPDTTISRSIIIELKRKKGDEKAEHFRCIDDPGLSELRQQAQRWANDNAEGLRGIEPTMPEGFNNRLGDNWNRLLAIAELAAGEWPDRAHRAAQSLSGTGDTASVGTALLRDIKGIFDARTEDRVLSAYTKERIGSGDLVGKLTADPDSRWAEWKGGKPLTQSQLARLLRPFGIAPEQVRLMSESSSQTRGYLAARFRDAWERYL
jgi:hypothetical protein